MAAHKFRFGLHFGSVTPLLNEPRGFAARIMATARAAENAGFDALFVPDHVWQNQTGGGPTAPMLEAYTLLGLLSAATTRATLGALVTPVMFRNPAFLAKAVASLDTLSDGRAMLGLGAGWDEAEMRAYGFDHPPLGERMARVEEAVQICRAMFAEEAPTFAGRYYKIEGALNVPRPLSGRIPIMIGGGGEKRTLRMVAQYGDVSNIPGDAAALGRKLDILKRHCDDCGRDVTEIKNTALVVSPKNRDDMLVQSEQCLKVPGIGGVIIVIDQPSPEVAHDWGSALMSTFGEFPIK